VDDTPSNAEFVEGILTAEGFATLTAHNGATARAITREKNPDLILLDVMMPGESGFDTCTALKSDPATSAIPIIFLSALDDTASKVKGLKIGGVDFVSKPVHAEELLARTRVHLRNSTTNRAMAEHYRAGMEQLRNAQRAILIAPADCPEASFGVHYESLEEAGGDFYDVIRIDREAFGYFVADVSGHGAGAAFLTSAIKALLRQYTGPVFSPEDTMRGIDSVMRQILGEEQYLTACYARFNHRTHRLSIVSAGHPPVIIVRADGSAQAVQISSEPLGVFSSLVLQRQDIHLQAGDRFFLYTDGLIECAPCACRNTRRDLLMAACIEHRADPIGVAVGAIARKVIQNCQSMTDDRLLLGVEVLP
jgi:sigma-B regulation protein RsbU (phosphoserine phosphatase)